MKTSVPFKQIILNFVLFVLVSAHGVLSQAQTSTELKFENVTLYSGSAGADGVVYKFPLVNNNVDALMTITGRSSSLVSIMNIDLPSQGFTKAFQPQIKYSNGNVNSATTWWVEFQIQFVNKNTTTPATISNFQVTGLDIDGNGDKLKEWDAFYGANSYTVENNTQLTVSGLTGALNLPLLPGKKFLGTSTDHSNIDTSATEIMTTVSYTNTSSMIIRLGATTTGSANNANRMYSIWFKNFAYTSPLSTLPVKLESFSAVLNNNKADLKWTTASEINVSHFVIEKSYDGKNFSDAGLVFAYGNTAEKVNYSFSDNVTNGQQAVIYYRLRSVDNDSKSQLSEIRIIRIGKKDELLKMVTYPNPASSELRVTIPSAWQGKAVTLEVFNQTGQRVKTLNSINASQTETIAVNDLAKGFYLIKASCGVETAQQKVVKN